MTDSSYYTTTDANTVATLASLSITKVAGVTTVTAGDGIICTYTITVSIAVPFFFNDTATTEIYTLSLHDALPIYAYGTCSGAPSFTCNLGTVAPGTPKSITVTYTVP